jgi:hypothetical protein
LDLLQRKFLDVAAQSAIEGEHKHAYRAGDSKILAPIPPIADQELQPKKSRRRLAAASSSPNKPIARLVVIDYERLLRRWYDVFQRPHSDPVPAFRTAVIQQKGFSKRVTSLQHPQIPDDQLLLDEKLSRAALDAMAGDRSVAQHVQVR